MRTNTPIEYYLQISNIVGNEIVDHSDAAEASPVDAAPTKSWCVT